MGILNSYTDTEKFHHVTLNLVYFTRHPNSLWRAHVNVRRREGRVPWRQVTVCEMSPSALIIIKPLTL